MAPQTTPRFDPDRLSPLRWLLRYAGRRCLRWFYRERQIVLRGAIPVSGPVLLIGNHGNDLPDVLLGLETTPRLVRYLATISVATGGMAARGYAAMGAIPVTRVRDARKMRALGMDMAAVNAQAGRMVADAMASGHVVGVFPQGGVHDSPQIGRLRTGVSMMTLDYVNADSKNDVTIVPFGIHYDAPRTAGSDVTVVVGPGWSLREWRYAQNEAGLDDGVAALTGRLRDALLAVTRNAPDWEAAGHRDAIVAAVAAVASRAATPLLAQAAALVPMAERVMASHQSEAPIALAAQVYTASMALDAAVSDAGGVRGSARDHARLLKGLGLEADAALPAWWILLMSTPVALVGWLMHGPIFWANWRLAHRLSKSRADLVARAFVPGLQVMLAYYVALLLVGVAGVLITNAVPWPVLVGSLVLCSSLPTFADVAVWWAQGCSAYRLVWRVRQWPAPHRTELRRVAEALRQAWRNIEEAERMP